MSNQVQEKPVIDKFGAIVGGIFTLLILFGVIGIIASANNQTVPESDAETTAQEEKPENEALSLKIERNTYGLMITNKEDKTLVNCEVQVNPGTFNFGYNARVDAIDTEGAFVSFSELTKGGERFNYETTAVETVVVAMCNDDERIGVYEF